MKQTARNNSILTSIIAIVILSFVKCTSVTTENKGGAHFTYTSKNILSDSIVEYNNVDGEILEYLFINTDYLKLDKNNKIFKTESVRGWIKNDTVYLKFKEAYNGNNSMTIKYSKKHSHNGEKSKTHTKSSMKISINGKELVNPESGKFFYADDDFSLTSELIVKLIE